MQEQNFLVTFQDNASAIKVQHHCYSLEAAHRYQDWLTAQGQESKLFVQL